ncbi:MAG: hypothetical protein AAGC93_27045 [Cyanobacteria bacterium P01_F01_bin.53]
MANLSGSFLIESALRCYCDRTYSNGQMHLAIVSVGIPGLG